MIVKRSSRRTTKKPKTAPIVSPWQTRSVLVRSRPFYFVFQPDLFKRANHVNFSVWIEQLDNRIIGQWFSTNSIVIHFPSPDLIAPAKLWAKETVQSNKIANCSNWVFTPPVQQIGSSTSAWQCGQFEAHTVSKEFQSALNQQLCPQLHKGGLFTDSDI